MEFEVSTIVERSAAVVWDFYAVHHVQNHPRWDPDMALEQVTSGPIGVGTVIRRRYIRFGDAGRGADEIVEFDPPRALGPKIRDGQTEMTGRGETHRRRGEPHSTDDSRGHHRRGSVDGREDSAARAAGLPNHQASHRVRVRTRYLTRGRPVDQLVDLAAQPTAGAADPSELGTQILVVRHVPRELRQAGRVLVRAVDRGVHADRPAEPTGRVGISPRCHGARNGETCPSRRSRAGSGGASSVFGAPPEAGGRS